ncbi:Myblike DNAbinding domain-containing protein [Tieghemiomyces parasiticus]|uniref:Myblike DNAbinding domain-containing protein n=1 Tax=Tieghemiomyces parasiticus TaxID=78921 RepID=A0A9W7ZNZ9_9FUNG|nr:Myblike DNAbinding domain-containing protein [Tieghemiomyces parasiticus]
MTSKKKTPEEQAAWELANRLSEPKRTAHDRYWTPEEDAQLLEAVKVHGKENWPTVAKDIGRPRVWRYVMERYNMLTFRPPPPPPWTLEDSARLMKRVADVGPNWDLLQLEFPRYTERALEARYLVVTAPESRLWRNLELQIITQAIKRYGTERWGEVARQVRTQDAQACYDWWYEHPLLWHHAKRKLIKLARKPWSVDHDVKLLRALYELKRKVLQKVPLYDAWCHGVHEALKLHPATDSEATEPVLYEQAAEGASNTPKGVETHHATTTATADPVPKPKFWHRVSLRVNGDHHPQHCLERWQTLKAMAALAKRYDPVTMERLESLRDGSMFLTVDTARTVIPDLSNDDMVMLLEWLDLRRHFSFMIEEASLTVDGKLAATENAQENVVESDTTTETRAGHQACREA